MNCLWPAASRISGIQPRTIFQSCRKIDSLAGRLASRSVRPYSISISPSRRREVEVWRKEQLGRIHNASSSAPRFWIGIRTFASGRAGIITDFEDLPKDYSDEKGLKFREKPFTAKDTLEVFGKGIDANSANRLLRVLHGRRVAGTLEDPDTPSILSTWEIRAQKIGLSWLREHVPVDEVRNYGLRAEKELQEMEAEIIADSERIGIYKPNPGEILEPNSQKPKKGHSVYGESGLDAIRKQKQKEEDEREAAEEAARQAQAEEIRHNTGTLEPISASRRVELRRPGENKWLQYYIERSKILPNTPPEMTWFQRLWPSALVLCGVLAFSFIFPLVYTPPKNSQRMFPDIPPAAATVLGLISINAFVFLLWRFPPAFRMLNKYFITVPGYPQALSLIGNVFSHQALSHLTVNMLVLYFVGSRLDDQVGRANFLSIYLACGAIGSFASLTSYVVRSNFVTSSLGASGALSGIIAAYLWLNKDQPTSFFGLDLSGWAPPLWVPLVLIIGLDVFALTKWNKAPITLDHWAHLGGYASGIGAAELLKYRQRQRREAELERRRNLGVVDRIKEGRL